MAHFSGSQEPVKLLNQVFLRITQDCPCDFAFYVTPTVPLETVSKQSEKLLQMKKNNVLRKSGVFQTSDLDTHPHPSENIDAAYTARWGDLLYEGNSRVFLDEIFQYLNGLCAKGN